MMNDMIESYRAQFYDSRHNCFLFRADGRALFDLCGNKFMAKHGLVIRDDSHGNVILVENKCNRPDIENLYQMSPYKWIERDAPIRYLDTFKYRIVKGYNFVDSSFARYGEDVDVMIPGEAWCESSECEYYFPMDIYNILDNDIDTRCCDPHDCRHCEKRHICCKTAKVKTFDYVMLIHDFIHGHITSISDLSMYIGDQLFDHAIAKEVYLWTPIIIYIIRNTLKIK